MQDLLKMFLVAITIQWHCTVAAAHFASYPVVCGSHCVVFWCARAHVILWSHGALERHSTYLMLKSDSGWTTPGNSGK